MNPGRRHRSAIRLRYLWRQLSKSRGAQAIGRVSRNFYRLALLVSAAIAIALAFPGGSARDIPVLEEGMVAPEDVIAPVEFPVHKSESELSRARADAAASVSPIFDYEPQLADSSVANAAAFFDNVQAAAAGAVGESEKRDAVSEVLERHRIAASENQLALLVATESRQRLQEAVASTFRRLLQPGVAARAELGDAGASGMILRNTGDRSERLVRRDSLTTMEQFYDAAASRSPSELGVDAHRLYQNIVVRFAEETIKLNQDATNAVRDQARLAVDVVKYDVLEGELIVGAHERVGAEQVERLSALQARLTEAAESRGWRAYLGSILYNLLLLLIFGLVLKYFRAEIFASGRSLALVWFLVLAVVGAAAAISRTGAAWQLIPIAFAALTLATLYDGLFAMIAVFVLVALVTARPPFAGVTVPFFTLMGGAAAALSGRVVRRRAHTWAFAAVIAAAYVLAALSLGLSGLQDAEGVLSSVFWGTVNAVGCTLLATGILPLAESVTRITTDQSLLELADLNLPLLRRLSLEAPGTYAHSINVANLAEAAAREIDANSLLVRVGVYYHDIGKVKKPQYFVENQPPGWNPHDKLKPATSANIVREHVKDGLELAEEARLPDSVVAFITEHHGTQRIGFFWEKAKEFDPDAELDPADFRYPGPKPQSQETAIALLADSVESAARVLQDPTPESIEELVDRIVGFKMSEAQLDEAPLTLREIDAIKHQFVKVLTSMYHHRLDYPLQNQNSQQAGESAAHEAP